MTATLYALIVQLADGKFHSGEVLGSRLGISRSAVWKSLQQLTKLGLELQAVSGRGYRLAEKIELLDESMISALLSPFAKKCLSKLEIFHSLESTNSYLNQQAAMGAATGSVCLAESQTAGRGRRGRNWHSPFGSNLYLSVLWRFNNGMSQLSGLSLAIAVALMRTFDALHAKGLGIKWPNDIISEQGKLAGILVDAAGESSGPCYAVIGIGVNYAMSQATATSIDQPWTQLMACGVSEGRNVVVATLLNHLFDALSQYQLQGFAAFHEEWLAHDMLRNKQVMLQLPDGTTTGVARGIDASGMLQVERQGMLHHYAAGEVSLRVNV